MFDLLFSYWLPFLYLSRVSHSGMAELTFSFDSASFFDSASYFGTLFGFDSVSYMQRNRKNSLLFLFSSSSSTEWHMIGLSFSRFFLRSSDPHGHIPCLERQEKGIRFDERV